MGICSQRYNKLVGATVKLFLMGHSVYLPLVANTPRPSRVGVQIDGKAINQVQWVGLNSFVVYRLYWSDEYQPERGAITWPARVDADMQALGTRRVILNIKNAPTWARHYLPAECSGPSIVDDYVAFVHAACQRYHPWMVSVWNEPEVSAEEAHAAGIDHYLGGFGLDRAQIYGALVAAVYDAVHPLGVLVVAGELLLPDVSFWSQARQNCLGRYDYVAYHAYSESLTTWGEVSRKAGQLRMLGDDRLICTETNYLWHSDGTRAETFDQDQANYLRWLFENFDGLGVDHLGIYAMRSGWRGADLIDGGQPKPAHDVYYQATAFGV
jgi:hypothetical protein